MKRMFLKNVKLNNKDGTKETAAKKNKHP